MACLVFLNLCFSQRDNYAENTFPRTYLYDSKNRGGITRRKSMRFDAKFTAVFAAALLGVSFFDTTPMNAKALSASTNQSTVSAAKTDTKKSTKTPEKQPKAPVEAKPTEPAETRYTVASGDSLSSIATAQNTTWTRLFNANESVADPNTLNPGQELRVPRDDEQLPDRYATYAAQQATVQAQVAAAPVASSGTTRSYTSAPVNSSSYYVGNGMWCTDYVHQMRPDVPVYGNAGYSWIAQAQADGKSTGTTPRAGAVAVTNGHVAYVENVNSDGSYTVSEMGWNYRAGEFNRRTVSGGAFSQFIY